MKTKDKAFIVVIIIAAIILISFLVYRFSHPELRNISHYNDDNYYMVSAITENNTYQGAIKKEDYNAWKDGTAITVWVVDSRDETRGWRLRCNTIYTIVIYDRKHLPLKFY